MITKLTFEENKLIELFFALFPQWKYDICQQIIDSKIIRYDDICNRSTCFVPAGKNMKPINTKHRVPVEIIIGEIQIPNEYLVKRLENTGTHIVLPGNYVILSDDAEGIQFHFNNGIIEEIEIYNLDGHRLENPLKFNENLTYIIYDKTLLKTD